MKLLKDILYRAGIEEVVGSTNVAIENVCIDSRQAKKFSLFIAVKGTQMDGHDYIKVRWPLFARSFLKTL